MVRWIVTLPLLAVGVSISGGDTAAAGSLIEAVAGALSPTKAPLRASAQEQKPPVSGARHRHRLVRRSKPQTPDPRTALAKARTSAFVDAHVVIVDEEDKALKPRRVATISVPPLADTKDVVALSTDDRVKIPSLASSYSKFARRFKRHGIGNVVERFRERRVGHLRARSRQFPAPTLACFANNCPRSHETCSLERSISRSIGSPKTISATGRNLLFALIIGQNKDLRPRRGEQRGNPHGAVRVAPGKKIGEL
jgi:hypothetical protein